MIYPVALEVLLFLIFWDSCLLKKHKKELFVPVFRLQQNVWLGALLFATGVLIFDPAWYKSLTVFILVFVFPLYFAKRIRFLKEVEGSEKFWVTAYGMRVILYWFFGMLLCASLAYGLDIFLGAMFSELEEMVAVAVFSSALLLFLIHQSASFLKPGNFWVAVGFSKDRISFIRKVFLPVVLGLGMAYFSATIIVGREFQPSTPLSEALDANESAWAISLFVVLALIVAPLVEEITFRGYFFDVLKRVKGQRFAFYVISLTFGALHMAQYWGDWAAIVVIMIMGFWLTGIRIWAGTTAASVVMHYFYNGGVVVMATAMEIAKDIL